MSISAESYEDNRRFIWGVCYRMTGNAADAEDIVQEVFIRALESPGLNTELPLRPWLVRVAVNMSRDYLRKRQRRGYAGPWLPSPVAAEGRPSQDTSPVSTVDSPATRYEMIESISQAFLLALEGLSPTQRAVLLLRDVFDYSTTEAAGLLGVTENTVGVTLYRARRVMRAYDREGGPVTQARYKKTAAAVERFLRCLSERDAGALEQLLTEDVVVISDGGGEVTALLLPMRGRKKVLQLVMRLNEIYRDTTRASICMLNGLPGVMFERHNVRSGHASRFSLQCEVDDSGSIRQLNYVLAPSKLTGLTGTWHYDS